MRFKNRIIYWTEWAIRLGMWGICWRGVCSGWGLCWRGVGRSICVIWWRLLCLLWCFFIGWWDEKGVWGVVDRKNYYDNLWKEITYGDNNWSLPTPISEGDPISTNNVWQGRNHEMRWSEKFATNWTFDVFDSTPNIRKSNFKSRDFERRSFEHT